MRFSKHFLFLQAGYAFARFLTVLYPILYIVYGFLAFDCSSYFLLDISRTLLNCFRRRTYLTLMLCGLFPHASNYSPTYRLPPAQAKHLGGIDTQTRQKSPHYRRRMHSSPAIFYCSFLHVLRCAGSNMCPQTSDTKRLDFLTTRPPLMRLRRIQLLSLHLTKLGGALVVEPWKRLVIPVHSLRGR